MSGTGFFAGLSDGLANGVRISGMIDDIQSKRADAQMRKDAEDMSKQLRGELFEQSEQMTGAMKASGSAAPGPGAVKNNFLDQGGPQTQAGAAARGISVNKQADQPAQPPKMRDLSTDQLADIYGRYTMMSMGNPYAQRALQTGLGYVKNKGIAQTLAGYTGDTSTMEGAMGLYKTYGRAMAAFGDPQDPMSAFNMANTMEAANQRRSNFELGQRKGELQIQGLERENQEGAYQAQELGNLRARLEQGGPGEAFGPFAADVAASAKRYGVRPDLLSGLLQQESSWNPKAVGDGGNSVGLGQFNVKGALADHGITKEQYLAMTPQQQIDLAAKQYAAKKKAAGGDDIQGLIDYNGGGDPNYLSNVMQHIPGGRVPRDKAIQDYGDRVSPGRQVKQVDPAEQRLKTWQNAYKLASIGDIQGATDYINGAGLGVRVIGAEPSQSRIPLPDGTPGPDFRLKLQDDNGDVQVMNLSDMVVGLGADEYKWEIRNASDPNDPFGDQQPYAIKVPKDAAKGRPQMFPLEVPSRNPQEAAGGAPTAAPKATQSQAPKPQQRAEGGEKPQAALVKLARGKDGGYVVSEGGKTRPLQDGDRFRYGNKIMEVKGGKAVEVQ